jgi:thiamine pyrophosphokinase
MATALVFAGGDPLPPGALAGLPTPELVVAADSGLLHAWAAGRRVDVLVGDFDSVTAADVEKAAAAGAEIRRHPAAKDETDLELALAVARARGVTDVVVVGGHGGRMDHLLANAFLLASPSWAPLRVGARFGDADITVVRDQSTLEGCVGALCSLLPVGGPALGVRTEGLRFPLRDEDLHPSSTRGVSNEFLEPRATVSLREGVLLAVLPDARKDHQ